MKKISAFTALLCAIIILLTFAGCGGGTEATTTEAAEGSAAETVNPASPEFFTVTTEEVDGVKFTYISGVTDAGKAQKVLEIPREIDGLTVNGIASQAFKDCTNLETLTVHSNIIEWMGNLFPGCTSLRKIVMDYGDLIEKSKTDETVVESLVAAKAFDESVTGQNSIIEGLSESKVKFVFTDKDTYDFFASHYTWGTYESVFELSN